ncbi:MAG TPA: type II toxin-antitoxin system RatA family toxin [Steroidobacteraceae bacterium]
MRTLKRSALLAQPPGRLYALINDIERYPAFLPWCTAARIDSRSDSEIIATLSARRGPLHAQFTTRNTLVPERSIAMQLVRGPFKTLEGLWTLVPLGDSGTRIELAMRFAFANPLTAAIFEPWFEQAAGSMVDAFVAQARAVSS